MKVRLSIAAELDSVPTKMAELLEENIGPLENASKLLSSSANILKSDSSSPLYISKLLDDVRKQMASIDENLSEINMILQGYVKASMPNGSAVSDEAGGANLEIDETAVKGDE